jgi:hypothetical protein
VNAEKIDAIGVVKVKVSHPRPGLNLYKKPLRRQQ